MNVTREVIIDLWPLYRSGEASDDTRQLIDDFLQQDEEFSRLIHESREESVKADALPPLGREKELETLRRAKRLVWIRDALFWIAIFLSATPFAVYHTSWGSGWVIRDLPWLACALASGAGITWCFFFALKRRLSTAGH